MRARCRAEHTALTRAGTTARAGPKKDRAARGCGRLARSDRCFGRRRPPIIIPDDPQAESVDTDRRADSLRRRSSRRSLCRSGARGGWAVRGRRWPRWPRASRRACPGRCRSFRPTNWWNTDVSAAPVDPGSDGLHRLRQQRRPAATSIRTSAARSTTASRIYGFPYIVVDGNQPKKTVQFDRARRERRRRPSRTTSRIPFYPIPDEAITQPHWVEGGDPGNVDRRGCAGPPHADRRPRQPASLRALQRLVRRRRSGRRTRARSST